MSYVIVLAVIVLGALVLVTISAVSYAKGRNLRRKYNEYDDQVEAARAEALWEVLIDSDFSTQHTIIKLQRKARMPWGAVPYGNTVVVRTLKNDDTKYDVELQAAMASARSRASEFNASLGRDYVTGIGA